MSRTLSTGIRQWVGGNVSLRTQDGFLITPSGFSLGTLTEDQLAKVDFAGRPLVGSRPSRESPMHLAIYRAREDVQAIVHNHSPHATALACLLEPGRPIPPYTPSYAYLVRQLLFRTTALAPRPLPMPSARKPPARMGFSCKTTGW